MSLDDIREILSWHPISELDQFRLSVKMQVMRSVFAIGTNALLDGGLGREAGSEFLTQEVSIFGPSDW